MESGRELPGEAAGQVWVGTGEFAGIPTRVKLTIAGTVTLTLRDLGLTLTSAEPPVTEGRTVRFGIEVQPGVALRGIATRHRATLEARFDSPLGDGSATLGRARRAVEAFDTPRVTRDAKPATRFRLGAPGREPDGWRVRDPADASVDTAPLRALGEAILARHFTAIDNVVLAVGGAIVFESYFYGRTARDLHTIQSCTKSVTALAAGIAVDKGFLPDLDAPVWSFFPERRDTRWVDTPYDATIRDLLAMRVGLDWDETRPYTDPSNSNTRMNHSEDWLGFVLEQPRRDGWPPEKFEYQSGLTILLGAVVARATGMSVVEFARRNLFGPLGIDDFRWLASPAGVTHTGGGLYLRPRDLLKVGELVRTGGTWNGTRVVSAAWIAEMTTAHARDGETGYGYQWWLTRQHDLPPDPPRAAALGWGGQSLHVFPTLDAQVVTNATDFADGSGHFSIVNDYILPALQKRR